MRFMMMTTNQQPPNAGPPDEKFMMEMGSYIEELTRDGILLATGGLEPNATHIRSAGGRIAVTDAPDGDAGSGAVGFALVEVQSKEQAVELSKRFWRIVGDGEGEIRQVFGPGDLFPG